MTCLIDHGIAGTIPAFLCRRCNPEEFPAWSPPRRARVEDDVKVQRLPAESRRQAATAIAKAAVAPGTVEYDRRSAKAAQKPMAPETPLDLDDDLKQVIHKRPGITGVIMDMMRRKAGATRAEMKAELIRLHPDRSPEGMYSTIQRQSRELSTGKREEAKRGTVYYIVVEE